jgi:tRNA modification GTPase
MKSSWEDTIVALATAQGVSAIGVIRLSGKKAIEIVNNLYPNKDLHKVKGNSLHVGLLIEDGIQLDEVVLSIFKSPKSYTGEDVVEISTHGSPFIQEQVINACIRKGARMAKPGEFTQRAFLKGKLDLTQAEAVADLIASNTLASQQNALKNIRGGFSNILMQLRDQLISFSALIELELDFSQEDVTFADRSQLNQLLIQIEQTVSELLGSFRLGNVIKNGVSVAIVGKPNAGKSTLLNKLLNENRAIVSAIAGTTRDTIEEVINIDGILFRLIDTAGIRESRDEIEAIGVGKSLEKMREADLVVYLFDVQAETLEGLKESMKKLISANPNYVLVGNKSDQFGYEELVEKFEGEEVMYISAQEGRNIEQLKQTLVEKVLRGKINLESTIVTNARHHEALQKVLTSIRDIQQGMVSGIPGDLLSLDIRSALYYLGEITGEITHEDQLDYIFSKFCIGK